MTSEQKQYPRVNALSRILQATSINSARLITYTAALLGMAALIPGLELPPELLALAGGIGVEAIGNIIEKVASGEHISDDEIRQQVEKAIEQSGIEKLLTKDDFYHAFAHLRRGQRILSNEHDEIIQTIQRIEQRNQAFENILLLEIGDEALTVNVPVNNLVISVQGPLKLINETTSPSIEKNVPESKPLLYDHKGNAIKLTQNKAQSAIEYSAKIVNKGEKTAWVYQVAIDYGSKIDPEKRTRMIVGMQGVYLAPGESRQVNFSLSQSDMISNMQKFETDECILFLRIICLTKENQKVMNVRNLGGFRKGNDEIEGTVIFAFSQGSALTGYLADSFEKNPIWLEQPISK